MADTVTPNYGFTKPEVGASDDTWGGKLNANWASLDTLLKSSNDNINLKVNKSGDYMTGQLTTPQLTVGNGIDSDAYLTLNIGAGAHYGSLVAQAAGSNRWALNFLGVPSETGSGNVGSDFNLIRCADNGTQIGSALSVIRATGVVTMPSGASLGGPLILPGGASNNVSLQFGGGAGGGLYASGTGASFVQNFVVNSSVKLVIDQSQVRANAPIRAQDGAVGTPAIAFTNDTDSGFYRAGAGDIRLSVDAGDVAKFLGSDKSTTFTGNVSSGGFIFSGQGTYISLHASQAILGMQSGVAGTIYLRPSGYDSTTGQMSLSPAGNLTVSRVVVGTLPDGSSAGGGIVLNKRASGFSEGIYCSDGAGGQIGYIGFDSTGQILLRAGDTTTNDVTIATNGRVDAAQFYASGNNFVGSATVWAAGPQGAGTVYLRPAGIGVGTGGVTLTNGVMVMDGRINADYLQSGTFSGTGATMGILINVQNANNMYNTSVITTAASAQLRFFNPNGLVGQISTLNSATTFSTSSDENLKEFNAEYDPQEAIAIIRADPVLSFNWKASGEQAVGWFAQKSYAVDHNLAVAPPEPEEGQVAAKPGEEGYHGWGIDYGRRTPYLWAALTNVLDRLEALETKLIGEAPKPMRKKAA